MAVSFDYSQKFESFKDQTLFEKLDREQQEFLHDLAFAHHLTFQEFRQVVIATRDLSLWGREA